jgi:hypothetical protein
MSTARHFDASKYQDNYIPGVPMRDLTEDEWEALDDDQKATVDASPFFRKTAPAGKTAARKADDKE